MYIYLLNIFKTTTTDSFSGHEMPCSKVYRTLKVMLPFEMAVTLLQLFYILQHGRWKNVLVMLLPIRFYVILCVAYLLE